MDNPSIEEITRLLNISQRWLTVPEACRYAKMSKNTLMTIIRSGEIRASKRRGKWIVDRLSIDQYYECDDEVLFKDIARRACL